MASVATYRWEPRGARMSRGGASWDRVARPVVARGRVAEVDLPGDAQSPLLSVLWSVAAEVGTPGGPIARRSGHARLGRSARDPSDAFRGGGRSYPPRSGSRRTGCVHGLARTGGPPLMMQPNRSTAAADEHRSSDACHQAMIFGSGHRLSREAYDDLSGP